MEIECLKLDLYQQNLKKIKGSSLSFEPKYIEKKNLRNPKHNHQIWGKKNLKTQKKCRSKLYDFLSSQTKSQNSSAVAMAWACCLGRARLGQRTAQATRSPGSARPRDLGNALPGFFCFFFFFFLLWYALLLFWGFVIIRVRKSSLRDSISMWPPRGKIYHIGQFHSMEIESLRLDLWAKIESQRLELLVCDIVS